MDYMTVGITPLKSPIDDWDHGGGATAAAWCAAELSRPVGGASELWRSI